MLNILMSMLLRSYCIRNNSGTITRKRDNMDLTELSTTQERHFLQNYIIQPFIYFARGYTKTAALP